MNNNIEENLNNEEKKRKSYFNLILALITLIIAIIGTTLAYFTSTATSPENDVKVNSSYLTIDYEGGSKITATKLIPTSENAMLWAYQENENQCVDANNRKVCYIYRFNIRSNNDINNETKILGKIIINKNEFIRTETCKNLEAGSSDLSYIVYKIDGNNYTKVSGYNSSSQNDIDVTLYETQGTKYNFTRFDIPELIKNDDDTETLKTKEQYLYGEDGYITIPNQVDNTFELVIWLHDDGCNQDSQQGKKFEATLEISADSMDNLKQ